MKMTRHINHLLFSSALALSLVVGTASFCVANAQSRAAKTPSLIITSGPLPESLVTGTPDYQRAQTVEPATAVPAPTQTSLPDLSDEGTDDVYRKPIQLREITAVDVVGPRYFDGDSSIVSDKMRELDGDLEKIKRDLGKLSSRLNVIQASNQDRTAEYFASIATINTQLQSGTTPSNPRLVKKLDEAERHLDALSSNVVELNGIAGDVADIASEGAFLLESTRAAYSLPGAVEEDHIRLTKMEDAIDGTLVTIERVLNTANDDITRANSYLTAERQNLRTLALGVSNGDLYGRSLANRPFANVSAFDTANVQSPAPALSSAQDTDFAQEPVMQKPSSINGPRPLVKIKFDRPDVDYEQPIYDTVTQALERYPDARFDLVAVNPTGGNAAQVAIETTKARRNGEKVLRTLTQMGLDPQRIDLSYDESAQAASSEVHLYVK